MTSMFTCPSGGEVFRLATEVQKADMSAIKAIMESTYYHEDVIHILGDGPYSTEVADQLKTSEETNIVFIPGSCDGIIKPKLLAVGIADPKTKRMVIESQHYTGDYPEYFILAIDKTAVIRKSCKYRMMNVGPLSSIGGNSEIGDFVSICSNVIIGHDAIIGEYSTICPGVVISGNVSIGNEVFIGAGAVIKNGIRIGNGAIIGCGSIVVCDVADGCTVVGNPARPMR